MARTTGISKSSGVRIGIDIGGTFTDLVLLDERGGHQQNLKAFSTPDDLAESVLTLIQSSRVLPEKISFMAHGTTVGINAILERKGPSTGIITTEGFEDILELRRCARTHLLDPFMEKPWIFIPREWRVGVSERIFSDGSISKPLDQDNVRQALQCLESEGVQSVAVYLLNSYANPIHEEQIKAIIAREFSSIYYSISSEVVREIKEYERTSTTALNAYLLPVVDSYLNRLSSGLRQQGIPKDFYLMQSNGQLMSRNEGLRKPVHTLESGPAGGAVATGFLSRQLGYDHAISFDMGGTTCKSAIIDNGYPRVTFRYELFEEANKPGSGWPIRVPMIEILEIPVAGGSMSWVDKQGNFHVGPESAGASPGPVCYNLGGQIPTVTDSNVVLGYVESLLGDTLQLNVKAARMAIKKSIADPLNLTIEKAAAGISEIADAKAADVVRQLTVAKGRDPRDAILVAFGGAGPLHAARILEELSMPEAVIPPMAGNFSALGLLNTDLGYDVARTHVIPTLDAVPESLNRIFRELTESVVTRLLNEGAFRNKVKVFWTIDMRYSGQLHEVNISLANNKLTEKDLFTAERDFHEEHLREFAYKIDNEPTEVVTFRVRAVWESPRSVLPKIAANDLKSAFKKYRMAYFYRLNRWVSTPVYQREKLGSGCEIKGPSIIEEMASTTLIPPFFQAQVDQYGNIRMNQV